MSLVVDIEKSIGSFILDVSFSTNKKPLGLLGGSGSGKSMTLRCIAGLDQPDKGKISLNDKIFFDSEHAINISCQERRIGFIFQNYALFPHLTVEENIAFGLNNLRKKERMERVKEQLVKIQLEDKGKVYPKQLSGGQQQRVALARALVLEPDLLLLDEPFSALDNHLRIQMEQQLHDLLEDFQGVTLFVSHDINESYRICENILIYHNGHIIADGHKKDVFNQPRFYEAAKITGCKNITKAKKISETRVYLPKWGIEVEIEPMYSEFSYLGIRAHSIRLVNSTIMNTNPSISNVYAAQVVKCVESPFRVMLYLDLGSGGHELLQWDISKEAWEQIKCVKDKLYIQIPKDELLLMT